MENSEDYTIAFEGRKVSDSATKAGRKVTFLVHPNDEEKIWRVLTAMSGTRFQIVCVQLEEETDEPVLDPAVKDGKSAVTMCGMLCRQENFQNWLLEKYADHFPHVHTASEESAAKILKSLLGIDSRSELQTNATAASKLRTIREQYMGDLW